MSHLINKILKEGVEPKIVYHFTSPSALVKMLSENLIKVGRNGFLSFTTDSELWTFRGSHEDEMDEIGVRLAFKTSSLPKLREFDGSNMFDDLSYEKEYVAKENIPFKAVVGITSMTWCKDFLKQNLPTNIFAKIKFE